MTIIASDITSIWENTNHGIFWFAVLLFYAKAIGPSVRAWFLWLLVSVSSLSSSIYYFDILVEDGRAATLCKAVLTWIIGAVLMVSFVIPCYKEKK